MQTLRDIITAEKPETKLTRTLEAEAQAGIEREWQCSYCDAWNVASRRDCAGCGRDSQEPTDDDLVTERAGMNARVDQETYDEMVRDDIQGGTNMSMYDNLKYPLVITADNIEEVKDTMSTVDQRIELVVGCKTWPIPRGRMTTFPNGRGAVMWGGDSQWGEWDEGKCTLTIDDGPVIDADGIELAEAE